MSGTEGSTNVNSNLQKQDLANLDISKLTPLSPEVISRQATINIGTIGHVAHGKSTVVKAISGVQTVRFKNELERNITIKLERLTSDTINEITSSPAKLRDFLRKRYKKDRSDKRRNFTERNQNNLSPTRCTSIGSSSCSSSSGYESLLENNYDLNKMRYKNEKSTKTSLKLKEFIVEVILSIQEYNSKPIFFVKWHGYPTSQNTWEPIEHLNDCYLFKKFIDKEYQNNKNSIELISKNILKEIEEEEFILENDELNVKNVEKFDNLAYTCDLILMAKYGHSGFMQSNIQKIIHNRIKRCSIIKQYYKKRENQLNEICKWKETINSIEIKSSINVENGVDYDVPHLTLNYINQRIAQHGIIIPDDPPIGCECVNICNYRSNCCAKMSSTHFAYNSKGRLRLNLGMPIFECNRRCKCDEKCLNRVVQNGRKNKLCIFKTSNNCGWGVKTEKVIGERQFVCEYVGEVITVEEADRRGKVYDAQGRTYLFDLDFNEDGYCMYTIDGANYGNVSHFINHSCEPNCAIWPVWDNCLDPNLPRLAIFTLRQIAAGEEITFDYICQNSTDRSNDSNENHAIPYKNISDAEKVPCRCGTASCRRFLF